jgi:hypothetical protein
MDLVYTTETRERGERERLQDFPPMRDFEVNSTPDSGASMTRDASGLSKESAASPLSALTALPASVITSKNLTSLGPDRQVSLRGSTPAPIWQPLRSTDAGGHQARAGESPFRSGCASRRDARE